VVLFAWPKPALRVRHLFPIQRRLQIRCIENYPHCCGFDHLFDLASFHFQSASLFSIHEFSSYCAVVIGGGETFPLILSDPNLELVAGRLVLLV
jgi:hypothetical protein